MSVGIARAVPRRAGAVALAATLALALAACPRTEAGRPGSPPGLDAGSRRSLAFLPPPGTALADRLLAQLQDRVRSAPAAPEPWVQLGRAWVRKARESADPGLYRSAEACAEEALARDPGHRPALALRGLVLLNDHRFEEARLLAQDLVERDPADPWALGILSDALLETGRFEEAAAAAQRMVDLKPSLPAYVRASHLMWLRGDLSGALETVRLAIDAGADPRDPEPRAWAVVHAATIFWHRGDYTGAEAGFDRALEQLADFAPALVGKGRVALARKDAAGAVAWLDRAFRLAPLPETAWLLGDARSAAGDLAGARQAYDLVARHGRAADHRTLALFLATKDREPAEAVRLAEEERRVRGDIYSEDTYAWALYRAGRIPEARAAILRATRLGTPDTRLLYHAGAIRAAAGEERQGLALVRAALRANPAFDWTGAEEARQILASGLPARTAWR